MAKSDTFSGQLSDLSIRVGAECLALHTKIGALTALTTTDKSSVIKAINEVDAAADALASTLNGALTRLGAVESKASTNTSDITVAKQNISTLQGNVATLQGALNTLSALVDTKTQIDDTKTIATSTWSSTKINTAINDKAAALKSEILDGVDSAYDTLKEIAEKLEENADLIEALDKIGAGHVKFDGAQTLTSAQQTQARTNIGAASQADHETAVGRITAVENKATTNANNFSALSASLGDVTGCDFVADFEAALAGSK